MMEVSATAESTGASTQQEDKCDGAWAPFTLDAPHPAALDELTLLIKKGRLGEMVIEAKASGADSVR